MNESIKPDPLDQIETLGHEVYGEDFDRFLATPRGSLHWETPAALMERGDYQPVLAVLIKMLDGTFS
jgi:hypothetical protein